MPRWTDEDRMAAYAHPIRPTLKFSRNALLGGTNYSHVLLPIPKRVQAHDGDAPVFADRHAPAAAPAAGRLDGGWCGLRLAAGHGAGHPSTNEFPGLAENALKTY